MGLLLLLSRKSLDKWPFDNPEPICPKNPYLPRDINCPTSENPFGLVPFGFKPVAQFPPFHPYRTPGVDTVAVIWREPRSTLPGKEH